LGPIEPEAIAYQPIVRVWLAVEMIEPIAPTWWTINEHIVNAYVLEAQDDGAAMLEALQYLDGYDIEVWDLSRPVGKLSGERVIRVF
jgi:hypothetical protein